MNHSADIGQLAKALAAAQGEMKNASKTGKGNYGKYAELSEVRDTVVPFLSKHGIAIIQGTLPDGENLYVFTRLVHESGEWIEGRLPMNDRIPQKMGSEITYARRYLMAAMCGIAAEDDDDGQAATDRANKDTANLRGTHGASKAQSRAPFEQLVRDLRLTTTKEALKAWLNTNRKAIEALPETWLDEFDEAYQAHKEGLSAREPAPVNMLAAG